MERIIKSNLTPLAFFEKDNLIIGLDGLRIKCIDINTNNTIKLRTIHRDLKTKLISNSQLLSRMYRLYPRACTINEDKIYFVLKGYLYSYNVRGNSLREVIKLTNGMSSPLSLCPYKGGVLFGEYLNNPKKEAVRILFADDQAQSAKVICIIDNIRHIHNVIQGSKSNEFIVFTGDDGDEAGIGLLEIGDKSSSFKFLVKGSQKYRGCVGSVFNEKLFFATDSPFEQNSLYCLDLNKTSLIKLANLPGTVIFGRTNNNYFYFSTSVESNLLKDSNGSNKVIKIDGKNGGILSKFSKIYALNLINQTLNIVDEAKKDFLGIHYFGFGTFLFSDCQGDTIVYSSKTLKKRKNRIYLKKLNN